MSPIQSSRSYQKKHSPEARLLHVIRSQPHGNHLYKEANEVLKRMGEPSVTINLIKKAAPEFRGDCAINRIGISILQTQKEKRAVLLFELANAKNAPRFREAHALLLNGGFKNATKYVRYMEKIEYDSLLCYLKIMKVANWTDESWGWVKQSGEVTKGFNHYYTNLLSETHKTYWRNNWKKVNKELALPRNLPD